MLYHIVPISDEYLRRYDAWLPKYKPRSRRKTCFHVVRNGICKDKAWHGRRSLPGLDHAELFVCLETGNTALVSQYYHWNDETHRRLQAICDAENLELRVHGLDASWYVIGRSCLISIRPYASDRSRRECPDHPFVDLLDRVKEVIGDVVATPAVAKESCLV